MHCEVQNTFIYSFFFFFALVFLCLLNFYPPPQNKTSLARMNTTDKKALPFSKLKNYEHVELREQKSQCVSYVEESLACNSCTHARAPYQCLIFSALFDSLACVSALTNNLTAALLQFPSSQPNETARPLRPLQGRYPGQAPLRLPGRRGPADLPHDPRPSQRRG